MQLEKQAWLNYFRPVKMANSAGLNPIQRKLNKILDTRLESDKEMTEALKALSGVFPENNLRSRRELRSDIERRSLQINKQFVQAFQQVKEGLDTVTADINAMATTCQNMCDRLHLVKSQTHELISKTTSLQSSGKRTEMKLNIAEEFLKKFTLSEEEKEVLRGNSNDAHHLAPEFFTALKRVQTIHNEVKILLRTNQQTAGLEIMESMALMQESAFERLYRWTQNQCRQLTTEILDPPELLLESMAALHSRPVLFRYSLDEYAQSRRQAVVRLFIDALTHGVQSRPIEMHSHDPLRYAGDMLAFLHATAANEKEQLGHLLKQCPPDTIKTTGIPALASIMEGLCRPFRARVEQVLVGGLGGSVNKPGNLVVEDPESGQSGLNSNPILLYKMANLLIFYNQTIQTSLGEIPSNSLFVETLDELSALCRKMFFNSLSFFASKILDKVEVPGPSLAPTEATFSTLQLLRDILSAKQPMKGKQTNTLGEEDLAKIVKNLTDPLMQMCAMSASQLPPADMAAYMVNCLNAIHSILSLFPFTGMQLEMLGLQMDAHSDTLISEQAVAILKQGGIAEIYQVIDEGGFQGPLSQVPGCERDQIKGCLERFEVYLKGV